MPGAGVRPYAGDTYTAPGKVITLEVGIHGIPVTMQQSVYDALAGGALSIIGCSAATIGMLLTITVWW